MAGSSVDSLERPQVADSAVKTVDTLGYCGAVGLVVGKAALSADNLVVWWVGQMAASLAAALVDSSGSSVVGELVGSKASGTAA